MSPRPESPPPRLHGAARALLIVVLLAMLLGFGSLSFCGGFISLSLLAESRRPSAEWMFLLISLPGLLVCGWAALKVLRRLLSLIFQRS